MSAEYYDYRSFKYLTKHAMTFILPMRLPCVVQDHPTDPDVILTPLSSNAVRLWIAAGYPWDGPSGPMPDTPPSMVPSAIHDAGYELLRCGALAPSYRKQVDKWFYESLVATGYPRGLAKIAYAGLRLFAGGAAKRTKTVDARFKTYPLIMPPSNVIGVKI